MITPAFGLTATERVLPKLALDFTTATTDARVTTTRANNTATRFNSSGAIEIVNANLPRYDFNPVTLVCRGQLIEEARTNLFLNSLINGSNLTTQSVTLTATPYTLTFYGTGSIVISGGHSATVPGAGAFPTRGTYVFTPTAGSSTFTVSGTVSYAQLEAGGFATSFIPTAGASVLRNADAVDMTSTNFSSWYNAGEGTLFAEASTFSSAAIDKFVANINNNGFPNRILMNFTAANNFSASVVSNSVSQVSGTNGTATTLNTPIKMCFATKLDNFAFSQSGVAPTTDNLGAMPVTVDRLWIGGANTSSFLNGHMRQVKFWPQRLTNAEVQAFSK
jgi:hypothetical protein